MAYIDIDFQGARGEWRIAQNYRRSNAMRDFAVPHAQHYQLTAFAFGFAGGFLGSLSFVLAAFSFGDFYGLTATREFL